MYYIERKHKIILLDVSQIQMQTFCGACSNNIDLNLYRHMILNSLRGYRARFHRQYGELVLCLDGSGYANWRKKDFKYYKASRKKTREASPIDWKEVFNMMDLVREEIKEIFPYKMVRVEEAEGDDVIAVLAREYQRYEKCLIISSDKDFTQLQQFKNIEQYCPRKRKKLVERNPEQFLHEHTMRGDTSDGIPNFLSPSDTFVTEGKRQNPLATKKLEKWLKLPIHAYCDKTMMLRYNENKRLIDLIECIPDQVETDIMKEFNTVKTGTRMKIMSYFIKHRMKGLLESLQDF